MIPKEHIKLISEMASAMSNAIAEVQLNSVSAYVDAIYSDWPVLNAWPHASQSSAIKWAKDFLDSLPDGSKTKIETLDRFHSTNFPGIHSGYKKDLELILEEADPIDEFRDSSATPWGAAQGIIFASIEGMIARYLLSQGFSPSKIGTGEKLMKSVDFSGVQSTIREWNRGDKNDRHLLLHGKITDYPDEESFYTALDKAVVVSEAIEKKTITLSERAVSSLGVRK